MKYFVHLFLVVLASMCSSLASAQTFTLKGVTFGDSMYLEEEELQAAAAPYLNRPIRFEDVQQMLADVNRLYAASGIPTAEAVLLPQEVPDGILKIDLIEATIGAVTVAGPTRASEGFVRRNVSLREGERPDYAQLERDLRIFGIAHDYVPTLTFGLGAASGTVDAIIGGEAPEGLSWTASLDNFGTEETGRSRVGISARWSNVTGVRDALSMQLLLSEGSGALSLGYSRPFGGWQGGRIFGTAYVTNADVIQASFAPLDILSDTIQFSTGYRVPFRVRPDSHFIFEAVVTRESTDSSILGLLLQSTVITEFAPQISWQKQWPRQNLASSLGFKLGSADTQAVSGTEGTYGLLFAAADYARLLSDDWVLNLSASMQYAKGQNLPVARLLSAGGVSTVRGYPNNVRSGDSGIILRTQPERRTPWTVGQRTELFPFGFFDAALVVPFRIDGSVNSDQDVLASIGAGLRANMGGKVNGLLMVGVPLRETLGFDDVGRASVFAGLDYRF
ncbi:MAG: ShlB/FhaC/HecB family hemolysin secretion/activation protein [Rhodobacter sp.]|nr:ShlB/FhaC/HecB family hemolysin secretion/activation protein [Rhodobacter sp.]MCA3521186.1 ShlB/FhaC/HecB family hemolysin secretion/activation protein [Rhodobacter sp.]MCA3528069.1 ShlB/FhaC/HecB family hemolysin secretion/activation protein [Rhodobacter sp.]MCA3532807.1 ShlB/FhaC/HecB family hemolysin secretion/activation protein [Rhodobacter sp.]MCA3536623.1 ShlB/FhaC/HecB family hemolysin secretion/activation protein [Rhodobacter sp.]